MTAIGLAISGDPVEIGKLRIAAGEDPREISRWVIAQQTERRANAKGLKYGN